MTFDVGHGARSLHAMLGLVPWQTHVVGEVPDRRMVVEYRFAETHPAVFGKFYADETGELVFQALRALDRSLARTQARSVLGLPTVLFYDPRHRFLAQRRVDGTPYPALLGRDDVHDLFRLAGQALAVLHAQRVPVGRVTWLDDHLRELIRPWPLSLAERWPEYRAPIQDLLATMAECEQPWRSLIEPAPIHRDVHLRQLFYGEVQSRVWLIDWDLVARGDPALDVGNLLVYLETHLADDQAARASAAFLDGYLAGRPAAGLLQRVPLYKAFTYLRLACKRTRLAGEGWQDTTWDLLRRAEGCLALEVDRVIA